MSADIVMTDWVIYETVPSDEIRAAVADWCLHNGVDSMLLCVPGWIGRNEDTNQVVYLTYTWEEDADGDYVSRAGVPELVARTVQLDHKPRPFPAELKSVATP